MDLDGARQYLRNLINKNLHVHTDDGRMFVGMFKCTDNERNIILSQAFEYREPSPTAVVEAASEHEQAGVPGNVRVDMTSRFMGLIVVPGKHITRVEAE